MRRQTTPRAGAAGRLGTLDATRHWALLFPDCLWNLDVWHLSVNGSAPKIWTRGRRRRTVEELGRLYECFPAAGLCFDIAHAHQVDTSMTEAYRILRKFSGRIRQLHVSEVTSSSKHDRISESALLSFREVADQLPRNVPVILESPVAAFEAVSELRQAARIFESAPRRNAANG